MLSGLGDAARALRGQRALVRSTFLGRLLEETAYGALLMLVLEWTGSPLPAWVLPVWIAVGMVLEATLWGGARRRASQGPPR